MTFITTTAMLITTTALAARPIQPEKCPDPNAIIEIGIDQETKMDLKGQWYASKQHHRYRTDEYWDFIIGFIIASDQNDAYKKAMAALLTLSFNRGPFYSPQRGWVCLYSTEPGYLAATTIS